MAPESVAALPQPLDFTTAFTPPVPTGPPPAALEPDVAGLDELPPLATPEAPPAPSLPPLEPPVAPTDESPPIESTEFDVPLQPDAKTNSEGTTPRTPRKRFLSIDMHRSLLLSRFRGEQDVTQRPKPGRTYRLRFDNFTHFHPTGEEFPAIHE